MPKVPKVKEWLEVIVEMEWLFWDEVKPEYEDWSQLLAIFASIGNK